MWIVKNEISILDFSNHLQYWSTWWKLHYCWPKTKEEERGKACYEAVKEKERQEFLSKSKDFKYQDYDW